MRILWEAKCQTGKKGPVALEEPLVSTLAQTNLLAKLLMEKGLTSEAEFMEKLSAERVNYQRVQRRHQRASC